MLGLQKASPYTIPSVAANSSWYVPSNILGGSSISSEIGATNGSSAQTTNQIEQNYQFRLSYAVDLLGKPLTC